MRSRSCMRSDVIWYCGECMSCRPRCPRGNTPAYVIQALRTLSQKLGFFVESEKGRQQLALKRTIGENILRTGYCVTPKLVKPELHPEQGTVWEWIYENDEEIYGQFSAAYNRPGAGALRKLDDRSMEELHRIFDVTGGKEFFDTIERHSDRKAREMGYDGADDAVHDGYLHQKFQRTLLAYETVELERLPEGDRRRQILLCAQLHPSELFSGQREGVFEHVAKGSGTRCLRRSAAHLVYGHRLPFGHRAAGYDHDGRGPAVRADDRCGV